MWTEDTKPKLWFVNEEGTEIIIHKLGDTTNYEIYQINEMKRLQELEEYRIKAEEEERIRQEEEGI